MIPIAPHITAYLKERLPLERGASDNTCASYAYAFKLLFEYASDRLKVPPSALCLEQLDAPLVGGFLHYLETERAMDRVRETSALLPSSRSCTSWNIGYQRR